MEIEQIISIIKTIINIAKLPPFNKIINSGKSYFIYKKSEKEIKENILKKYSDEPFYDDLDKIISKTDILNTVIFSCYLKNQDDKPLKEEIKTLCKSYDIKDTNIQNISNILIDIYREYFKKFNESNGNDRKIINHIIQLAVDNKELMSRVLEEINKKHATEINRFDEITELIKNNFKSNISEDIKKIKDHNETILDRIKSDIGKVHIERKNSIDEIEKKLETADCIFIEGEMGYGKSAIVKELTNLNRDNLYIVFSADELSSASVNNLFTSIGLHSTVSDIKDKLSVISKKYLVIDSLEKILENNGLNCFIDLINFSIKENNIKIICTVRNFASEIIAKSIKEKINNISIEKISVDKLNDDEIRYLCDNIEKLKPILYNKELKHFTENLFYLSLIYTSVVKNTFDSKNITPGNFEDIIWSSVVRNDIQREKGFPDRREKLFLDIAIELAKTMRYAIDYNFSDLEFEIKDLLEKDSLILINDKDKKISLPHDIWLDWCVYKYIDKLFTENEYNIKKLFSSLYNLSPVIKNIGYKNWLLKKYNNEDFSSEELFNIIKDSKIKDDFKTETVTAILESKRLSDFIKTYGKSLIEDNYIDIFLETLLLRYIALEFNLKYFNIQVAIERWAVLISLIYDNIELIKINNFNTVIKTIWTVSNISYLFFINDHDFDKARKINSYISSLFDKIFMQSGLLSFYILEKIKKEKYTNKDILDKLCETIIKTSPYIQKEFSELFNSDILNYNKKNHNKYEYIKIFIDKCIKDDFISTILAKCYPDELIKLSLKTFIKKLSKEEMKEISFIDIGIDIGIEDEYKVNYASALVPPFASLFLYHPKKAIDFVIELCNIAARNYLLSSEYSPDLSKSTIYNEIKKSYNAENFIDDILNPHKIKEVSIELNDGTTVKQIASSYLWTVYRGLNCTYELIGCALMAFENWLIDFVQKADSEKIENIYNKVLKNSNSVLTSSVLASVASGFPEKVGKSAYPLFREPMFFTLDITRIVYECVNNATGFNIRSDYKEERKKSMEREWRRISLRDVFMNMQVKSFNKEYSESKKEIFDIIDRTKEKYKDDENILEIIKTYDFRNYKHATKYEDRVVFSIDEKIDIKNNQRDIFLDSYTFQNQITDNMTDIEIKKMIETIREICNYNYENIDDSRRNVLYSNISKTSYLIIKKYHEKIDKNDFDLLSEIILNTLNIYNVIDCEVFEILPILYKYIEDKDRVKRIMFECYFTPNYNISLYTAVGIKEYLCDIDKSFFEQFFENVIYFLENKLYGNNIKENEKIFFEKHNNFEINNIEIINFYSAMLLYNSMIIYMGNKNYDKAFLYIEKILYKIINTKEDIYYRKIRDKKYIEVFAKYIFEIKEEEYKKYYKAINDACKINPHFVFMFLICLEELGEKNNNAQVFWNFYKAISDTMVSITISSNNKNISHYSIQLIRHMVFADMPWKELDIKNQYIKYGKDYTIDFAEKTCVNINIFEGLSSLMSYYNDLFFEDGIKILASLNEDIIKINLGIERTITYLEKAIEDYLKISGVFIDKNIYSYCIKILDILINKNKSSKAFNLKNIILKNKKIK